VRIGFDEMDDGPRHYWMVLFGRRFSISRRFYRLISRRDN